MNLRNGKTTAFERVVPKKKEPEDPSKEFVAYLKCLFFEVDKYDMSSYMRACVLGDLYEFVDDHVDQFKDVPRLAKTFDAIRQSCLRILPDLGTLAMKKGKDPEFAQALSHLSNMLLRVLAKLGSE
jgi:hypothetical protein